MTTPDTPHPLLEPAAQGGPPGQGPNWDEPVPQRRPPSVKCPRCLTMNTAEDPRCVACQTPLGDEAGRPPPVPRGRRAARWGLVALAVGTGVGPLVGDGITLVARTPGGPNVNLIVWACLGGGVGAVLGYVVGLIRPGRQ